MGPWSGATALGRIILGYRYHKGGFRKKNEAGRDLNWAEGREERKITLRMFEKAIVNIMFT